MWETISKLRGCRTYIIAIAFGVMGILKAFGVDIPQDIELILGGVGLASLRASIPTDVKPPAS